MFSGSGRGCGMTKLPSSDDPRAGFPAWIFQVFLGLYALLCGCILEVTRSLVMTQYWNSAEPMPALPGFFLVTLSSEGLWPRYPVYLEVFLGLFLVYLRVSPAVRKWGMAGFYLFTAAAYGVLTILAGILLLAFLLALKAAVIVETLPKYSATPGARIIHLSFLAIAVLLLIESAVRFFKNKPKEADRK